MGKTIKFDFFWPSFDWRDEWLFRYAIEKYNLTVIEDGNADYTVYSFFGGVPYSDTVKIYYSAENAEKNRKRYKHADWTISHHKPSDEIFGGQIDAEKHLYMTIFLRKYGPEGVYEINNFDAEKEFKRKDRFCCLVTRNYDAHLRKQAFDKISSKYKRVDSAGQAWNNMKNGWSVPGDWSNLFDFARRYKFMINVENDVVRHHIPGYTSEKIYTGFRSRTVPIYGGDPEIGRHFNEDSFVNLDDYDTIEDAIGRIKYLDNNDDAYLEMLSAKKVNDDNPIYKKSRIDKYFDKIFS